MKRRTCLLVSVITLFVLAAVLVVVLGASFYSFNRQDNVDSAIKATREWGRLAPFPESASDLDVVTEGSMFTRAFRVTFQAPLDDIEQWIESSPGLEESTVEMIHTGTSKYVIEPGEGAAYAEVVITVLGDGMGLVEIYAYWS